MCQKYDEWNIACKCVFFTRALETLTDSICEKLKETLLVLGESHAKNQAQNIHPT